MIADRKKHKCPMCEYETSKPGNLKEHIRTHTGQCYVHGARSVSLIYPPPYTCCPRREAVLLHRVRLRHVLPERADDTHPHPQRGTPLQVLALPVRGADQKRPHQARAEARRCVYSLTAIVSSLTALAGDFSYRCNLCDFAAASKSKLIHHHAREHRAEAKPTADGHRPLCCDKCGAVLEGEQGVSGHQTMCSLKGTVESALQ